MFLNSVFVTLLTAYNAAFLFRGMAETGAQAAPLKITKTATGVIIERDLPNLSKPISHNLTNILSPKPAHVAKRDSTSFKLNGTDYNAEPLPEGSSESNNSTLYALSFQDQPAILRVVKGLGENDTTMETECNTLNTVELWIYCEKQQDVALIVTRDIRHDYPNPNDELRTFTQWFQNGTLDMKDWDAFYGTFKSLVNSTLIELSQDQDHKLYYHDLRIRNFLVNQKFDFLKPTNWAPRRDDVEGVTAEGYQEWAFAMADKLWRILDDDANKEKAGVTTFIDAMNTGVDTAIGVLGDATKG